MLLIIGSISTSCSFLDIDTPGIVNDDKMFENPRGYEDAMTGIYARLAKEDLYGEQLSFGFIDAIAQLYYNDYETYETTLNRTIDLKYKDTDVRNQIDRIWNNGYNVISSANCVLENLGRHDFAILPRIEGEALAIRAYLHFDLLRLFAPGYDKADSPAIPYTFGFSIIPDEVLTVKEVYNNIEKDLLKAYEKLSEYEVYLENLQNNGDQNIKDYRKKNVYINKSAVASILARVYTWSSDYKNAKIWAKTALNEAYKDAINSSNETDTKINCLLNYDSEIKTSFMGYLTRKECIWGLNSPMLYLDVRKRFMNNRLNKNILMVRDNYHDIFNTNSFTAANNDYRYQAYFSKKTQGGKTYACLKKFFDAQYDEDQIPTESRNPGINLIRVPELLLILAEAEYETDKAKSLEYLNALVHSRGLLPYNFSDIETKELFTKVLVNEIVKELWGEGQIFFTYKRFHLDMNGVNNITHSASEKVYNLPIPEAEKQW